GLVAGGLIRRTRRLRAGQAPPRVRARPSTPTDDLHERRAAGRLSESHAVDPGRPDRVEVAVRVAGATGDRVLHAVLHDELNLALYDVERHVGVLQVLDRVAECGRHARVGGVQAGRRVHRVAR